MLIIGDAAQELANIPTDSVNCVVTSPPYWGLREYSDEPDEIGREGTLAEFVERLVDVFRSIRRVLRDDGVVWLNVGDSYANDAKWGGKTGGKHRADLHGATGIGRAKKVTKLPPKCLVGTPWRLVTALVADGWIWRNTVIWHKPNPLPIVARDRLTSSWEPVFLLAQTPTYWFDAFPLREDAVHGTRHPRDVWSIPVGANRIGHVAVFPDELARRCIASGCPERVCSACEEPWIRDVERVRLVGGVAGPAPAMKSASLRDVTTAQGLGHWRITTHVNNRGHVPACACGDTIRPGVVMDPFMGSGTVAAVAQSMKRGWIGIDLDPDCRRWIAARTAQLTLPI